MKNRILLAVVVAGLALATLFAGASAATSPKVVKFKTLDQANCPVGVIYSVDVPSPATNDTAVLRIVVTGSVAPSTPIFGTPVYECTLTTTWSIVVDPCSLPASTDPTVQC